MNQEQRQAIQALTTYPEFWALNAYIHSQIEELDKCSAIKEDGTEATQAMGRKYAVTFLKKMLTDVGISATRTEKINTYE